MTPLAHICPLPIPSDHYSTNLAINLEKIPLQPVINFPGNRSKFSRSSGNFTPKLRLNFSAKPSESIQFFHGNRNFLICTFHCFHSIVHSLNHSFRASFTNPSLHMWSPPPLYPTRGGCFQLKDWRISSCFRKPSLPIMCMWTLHVKVYPVPTLYRSLRRVTPQPAPFKGTCSTNLVTCHKRSSIHVQHGYTMYGYECLYSAAYPRWVSPSCISSVNLTQGPGVLFMQEEV